MSRARISTAMMAVAMLGGGLPFYGRAVEVSRTKEQEADAERVAYYATIAKAQAEAKRERRRLRNMGLLGVSAAPVGEKGQTNGTNP